jgi:cell division protein FtsN
MAGRRSGSRTGTFLVLAGIVGVLSATFIAGVWTGHHWPVIVGNPRAAASAEPSPPARRRADTLPALTFYDELTAPLTAPPPAPKRPRAARPAEPRKAEPDGADSAGTPAREEVSPAPAERFTIQVAAYSARTLAETLRATLAAAGHDARVVATESGGSTRYRVQVGTFSTREGAREAALRLAAERSQPAFVTTR